MSYLLHCITPNTLHSNWDNQCNVVENLGFKEFLGALVCGNILGNIIINVKYDFLLSQKIIHYRELETRNQFLKFKINKSYLIWKANFLVYLGLIRINHN